MRTEYAFICDFALESAGKVNALGIGWTRYFAPTVPVTVPNLSAVVRLSGTIAEVGSKTVVLKLIDADGVDVITPVEANIELVVEPGAIEGHINLIVNLNSFEFAKYGQYAFHFLMNGNEIAQIPFAVVEPPSTT